MKDKELDLNVEIYFNKLRDALRKCKTTNEILEVMTAAVMDKSVASDHQSTEEDRARYKSYLRRTLNKKFKGDFNKSKAYCMAQVNGYEHDYFDRQIEERYATL